MLPVTESTLVVRTDFADSGAWDRVRKTVADPPGGDLVSAAFTFVDDPRYAGLSPISAIELVPRRPAHQMVALADTVTLATKDMPLLVVDLVDDPGQRFRSAPEVLWHVANNLFVAKASSTSTCAASTTTASTGVAGWTARSRCCPRSPR